MCFRKRPIVSSRRNSFDEGNAFVLLDRRDARRQRFGPSSVERAFLSCDAFRNQSFVEALCLNRDLQLAGNTLQSTVTSPNPSGFSLIFKDVFTPSKLPFNRRLKLC
jgi:hypothetical protein